MRALGNTALAGRTRTWLDRARVGILKTANPAGPLVDFDDAVLFCDCTDALLCPPCAEETALRLRTVAVGPLAVFCSA